jgi:hypothetical protein
VKAALGVEEPAAVCGEFVGPDSEPAEDAAVDPVAWSPQTS